MTVDVTAQPSGRDACELDELTAMLIEMHDPDGDSGHTLRLRASIVERCLPMADRVALRFRGRGESQDDLTQVARLGLMKAVDRFDPTKGNFLAYAWLTMMGEVRRHFRDHGWTVHVPRTLKERNVALAPAITDLTQLLGRSPTATELAKHMGLSRDDVIATLLAAEAYRPSSFDVPSYQGGDSAETLGDTVGGADDAFERIDDQQTVRRLLSTLPRRDRTILYLRFFETMTQSEIAERMGVSQMHVSRILQRSLRALRNELPT